MSASTLDREKQEIESITEFEPQRSDSFSPAAATCPPAPEIQSGEDAADAAAMQKLAQMSHRQILEVLSGLLIAMFVANMAGTIVGNALPTITGRLGSSQAGYTWIVTSTLLASTATTPIWGKLADLFNKKKLLMAGIGFFIVGSAVSGAAMNTAWLIGARAIQGIGFGAIQTLIQAIIGTVIPPRQRGRYMAYTGAAIAAATAAGPLIGGFIVDQPWLGWRWCFWSAIPFAIVSVIVLQWKLHVPTLRHGRVKVDWLGAALITAAASTLLIWISFADKSFSYISWQSGVMVGGFLLLAAAFVVTELKVSEPIIPMRILLSRATGLAVIASIAVGIAMFGSSVFLGQYFQIGRGFTPTDAGLLMLPMIAGNLFSSIVIGRLVSRMGSWKPFVVTGAVLLTIGFGTMATMRYSTPLWLVGIFSFVTGLGVGMALQNLVLAIQNTVSVRDVGAATATVTFFRSLGGTIGIQVLGVVYSNKVSELVTAGLAKLHTGAFSGLGSSSTSLDFSKLPSAVVTVLREAYGNGIGQVFLVGAVIAAISILATLCMKGTKLRASFDLSKALDESKRD